MNRVGKTVLITALTAVVCLGIATTIFFIPGRRDNASVGVGFRHSVDETKTALLTGIETISINTSSTDIHLLTESREDVTVRFYGTVRSSSKVNLPELTVEKKGDTLVLSVTRKDYLTIGFYSSDSRLDVVLPRSFDRYLKVNTSSGDLNLTPLSLEGFEFDSSSGDAFIDELSASSVRLKSSSGKVEAGEITSSETFRNTSSGKTVIEVFSGDLDFESSSGDLTVSYQSFDNNVVADSSSGDIELNLPSDAGFVFEVNTSSGEIETEFPFTVQGKVDKRKLKGSVGEGSGFIRIETSSGDVRLKR